MPSYEYICDTNNQEFETFHSIKIVLEECPVCKEKGLPNHAPRRLIGTSTTFQLKPGKTGWSNTGYR